MNSFQYRMQVVVTPITMRIIYDKIMPYMSTLIVPGRDMKLKHVDITFSAHDAFLEYIYQV